MAADKRPASWTEWKTRHPRWPWLTGIEWALEWLVYWCRGLAIFEVLDYLGRLVAVASVGTALLVWLLEADDRVKQKHYRAWELINSARGATGDGGRRDALQDLHEDKVPLVAAPLAKAYLVAVRLPNANLSYADLAGADLTEANLDHADLTGANLTEANLSEANLTWTSLARANLSEANLTGTNLAMTFLAEARLYKANLLRAQLYGTYLVGANLAEANLKDAKFCLARLPSGEWNNRDCVD